MDINQKYKYGSIPMSTLRAGASILYGHLLMCEIMMADLTQKYVINLSNELVAEGMAKHKLKQLANQMMACSRELKQRCDDHDEELVIGFTIDTWPGLSKRYFNEGGTVTQRIQLMFKEKVGNLMTMIHVGCKNCCDVNSVPHSLLVAHGMMVLELSTSSIDLFDFIVRKIRTMLGDAMRIVKSNHNERMRNYAREFVRLLTPGYELPESEATQIRGMTEKFYGILTSEDLLKSIDNCISDMRNDYGRFVLTILAGKVQQRSLSLLDIKLITARVGSFANTRRFVEELRSLQVDPSDDPMDVKDELNLSPDTTPLLSEFLRLCHDDEKMEVEKEDERKVRLRELRQEARANGGVLPEGSLIQLYKELGTKKAVDELLSAAGDELIRSRRVLRKLNVTKYKQELKEKTHGRSLSQSGEQIPGHCQAVMLAQRGGTPTIDASRLPRTTKINARNFSSFAKGSKRGADIAAL
jgi:hypothetical protein